MSAIVVAPARCALLCCRHNPNSKKSQVIAGIPNVGLCQRCHDIIEWRKKFRKYKPIKNLTKWCAPISTTLQLSVPLAHTSTQTHAAHLRSFVMHACAQPVLLRPVSVFVLAQCLLRREEGAQCLPSVVHRLCEGSGLLSQMLAEPRARASVSERYAARLAL
jgi:hypothetical protein